MAQGNFHGPRGWGRLRAPMRLPSRPALAIALGSLAAACALWSPAFFQLQATGFGDWQFFHHMWEAGYVALTRYGEWPLWDPYHCGGITIFGNPQSHGCVNVNLENVQWIYAWGEEGAPVEVRT